MFDLFGIKRRNEEIKRLKSDLKDKETEIADLKAKILSDFVCDGYCSACKNGIAQTTTNPYFGPSTSYLCVLKCKCENFDRKYQSTAF